MDIVLCHPHTVTEHVLQEAKSRARANRNQRSLVTSPHRNILRPYMSQMTYRRCLEVVMVWLSQVIEGFKLKKSWFSVPKKDRQFWRPEMLLYYLATLSFLTMQCAIMLMWQSLPLWAMRTQVPGCFPSFNQTSSKSISKVTRYQIARNHYQNQQSAVNFRYELVPESTPKKKLESVVKIKRYPKPLQLEVYSQGHAGGAQCGSEIATEV